MPLQVHDVDLAAVVRRARRRDRARCGRSPACASPGTLPATLPSLRTDPVKLKVVLKNLIHNAIKFTDAGAVTVGVSTAPRAGRVRGRRHRHRHRAPSCCAVIFEPFRQGDSSSTRSYGGVGLGLYIVRRLLDLLGGDIAVESELGRGSRFRFWLPLRSDS